MDELIASTPPEERLVLDRQIRWRYTGNPTDMMSLSMHPSGWVREKAVRQMAESDDPRVLTMLLVRVNDWVQPIRQRALQAVLDKTGGSWSRAWLDAIPLMALLGRIERPVRQALRRTVQTALQHPQARDAMEDAFTSPFASVRTAALEELIRHRFLEPRHLLSAISDDAPRVRLLALQLARRYASTELVQQLVDRARRDAAPRVRREAFSLMARRDLPIDASWLMDRDPSVRRAARKVLPDAAAVYRNHLVEHVPTLAVALEGLRETVPEEAAEVAIRYLDHEVPKIRRLALRAWAWRASDEHIERLLAALDDPSPAVSAEARTHLLDITSSVPEEVLWCVYESTSQLHTRRRVLDLVGRYRKWFVLTAWLEALSDDHPVLQQRALNGLQSLVQKFNREFTSPSDIDVTNARVRFDGVREKLPEPLYKELSAILRATGK